MIIVKTDPKRFADNVTFYMKMAQTGRDVQIVIDEENEKFLRLTSEGAESKPDIINLCTHEYDGKSAIRVYNYPCCPIKECLICGKIFPLNQY